MSKYEEALRQLNAAQKKAVETIDGPVLVIAGPGTGKTQLLTTRIAHILAKTDTLPQNILCLTFTDSAAQTMQTRLSNMIGQGAYDVTMSTYHAFGSDLIRRYPDYFADDANLQPADDLTIDRTLRAIVASLPYSNPLKYADMYISDIKTLISNAKQALLAPKDVRSIAKDNLAFIARTNPIVQKELQGFARLTPKAIPLFANLLDVVTNEREAPKTPGDSTEAEPDPERRDPRLARENHARERSPDVFGAGSDLWGLFVKELSAAVASAQESGKTMPLTAWKKTWLAKDATGQFIVDGEKTNHKLLAAADIYEAYIKKLKARQLYDYDDMILRAVHALETNDDLRYTLQEQYQYLLLDEFQDTNGAQLRIVELLTDNPVYEGRPNVLAVGDDDQAIYAFQGADYSHMLQFTSRYKNVVVIPLVENYRSHPDILHTAHGIAQQIEERLHHHFPDLEKELVAKASLPSGVVERRQAASDVMQYAWVTKQIETAIAKGTPANDIAVLAPQHKYLEPLVPFLQKAGIPVRYDKRENILDEPGIVELVRMAELALALKQRNKHTVNALWAEVLSFDFWQLPTSRIWQLSWQANDGDHDWTKELLADEALAPIALFFIRLSLLAGSETLESMLDYLIGSTPLDLAEPGQGTYTSPYYEHYFGGLTDSQQADFWHLLTSLIVLRARLREYRKEDDERLYLTDFIDFIEAHQAAELKILNTSPYASGTKAVQLMTAYKAKGMEFGNVYVLAVSDEAWGGTSRSSGNRIALPPNLQHIRYKGSNDDERLRLFYVAITRAKAELYLVDYASNYAGKATTRLKYLNETTDESGVLHSPLLPIANQAVLPAEETAPEPTTELAAYWQTRHAQSLTSADLQSLLHERLARYQLSPTHLGDFIDVANCGPHSFFLRTILRFPQAMRPEVHFGNAMHETLEWLHLVTKKEGRMPAATAVQNTFTARLQSKQLNDTDLALFTQRGHTALHIYLQQRAATTAPDNVVEYNFRNEGVFIGDAHIGGKIDKLIVDKQAKTIVIVDYKTGTPHTSWGREVKLHKYRWQLYFYKALVEGSHTFAGYTVTDAYLEFVEPDEAGQIQELHLPFDEAEYQRLRRLAQAVWHKIIQLDVPGTGNYTPNLAGIEKFESDLLQED